MSPINKYELFVNTITDTIRAATPRKKQNTKAQARNPVPWWDSDCNKAKRLRRASFRKWEFSNKLEDLIQYKKNCAYATQLFKKKRLEYVKEFAQSINFNTNSKHVWNTFKILKNSSIKVKHNNNNENYNEMPFMCLNNIAPPWVSVQEEYIPSCEEN